MASNNTYDLIVIGGGILGTFSAYHALNLGKKVALLERNKSPRQATVRNFGQIVPSGLSQSWLTYGKKSLEIYGELVQKGDFTFRQTGTYYLASDDEEKALLEELEHINRSQDYPCEILTTGQVLDAQPTIRADYVKAGLYFPQEYSVDPRLMIGRVLSYLEEQKGLSYFPYHLAVGVENGTGENLIVRTSNGKKIEGASVLICSGAEYQTLFPEAFPNEKIQCSILHMMVSKAQTSAKIKGNVLSGLSIRRYESFRACPSYPEIKQRENLPEDVKEHGIHILFKQADNGQVIIGDSHHYADAHDKDELGFDFDREVEAIMLREAKKVANLDTWEIAKTWTGIYPQERSGEIFNKEIAPGIHTLTAIGGKGMTASPGYTFTYINKLFGHD